MTHDNGSVHLAADGLAVLGGLVPLDGRISWYDRADGRFVPFNTYLLREGDDSLLVEAGVPIVFDAALAQVRAICGNHGPTRLAVTRNEPDCVANIPGWVSNIGLRTVHSPGLMNTLQFFPADQGEQLEQSFVHGTTELQMLNFGVRCSPALPGGEVPVGERRRLKALAAPLKILPTVWYYDEETATLFCSDSFAEETASAPDQRVLRTVGRQRDLIARFRRSFELKFDWLARSDLSTVIADLEAIFDEHPIERLAPSRGLVVEGRAAVAAKQEALLGTLWELNR